MIEESLQNGTYGAVIDMPLDDLAEITGIVIYKAQLSMRNRVPLTRIELLSPANKPGGSHYQSYYVKRQQTLHSEINLVEIDYLHERPPIIASLPDYTRGDEDSSPYQILVSVPHPTIAEGKLDDYSIGVLDPLPTVAIPLEDDLTVR